MSNWANFSKTLRENGPLVIEDKKVLVKTLVHDYGIIPEEWGDDFKNDVCICCDFPKKRQPNIAVPIYYHGDKISCADCAKKYNFGEDCFSYLRDWHFKEISKTNTNAFKCEICSVSYKYVLSNEKVNCKDIAN